MINTDFVFMLALPLLAVVLPLPAYIIAQAFLGAVKHAISG